MSKRVGRYAVCAAVICAVILVVLLTELSKQGPRPEDVLAGYRPGRAYHVPAITYPFNGAVFPPDIAAPTIRWKDGHGKTDRWLVVIGREAEERCLSGLTDVTEWTPSDEQWEAVKRLSLERDVKVTVLGIDHSQPKRVLSAGSITIRTSKDEVGAPLFYQEVNLPFFAAFTDPSQARWRFGPISSKHPPPVVMENLPVCASCHSFSADGSVVGMNVDCADDTGSYAIAKVAEEITLGKEKIIAWSDCEKAGRGATYGMFSQVSPDGRYVVASVADRAAIAPGGSLAYSVLFFPVRGILAVYDSRTKQFRTLRGADDPKFVHTNPCWSPDGKYIVFARSKAVELPGSARSVLLSTRQCRELLGDGGSFQFDLYKIPFNNGEGGTPEAIRGASHNGMSNYFPKYSPKGKWIVFCKARSFMLLQPDSKLYIIRRWLVFSSKANRQYTQLFLAHIDEAGHSSPPVVLERFTRQGAAVIPEFVSGGPAAIRKIREQFMDYASFIRAGDGLLQARKLDRAARAYQDALSIKPQGADALNGLGLVGLYRGSLREAWEYLAKAVEASPEHADAHVNLGALFLRQDRIDEAVASFEKALQIDGELAGAHQGLGYCSMTRNDIDQAIAHWKNALAIEPDRRAVHLALAAALPKRGGFKEAVSHYRKALELSPNDANALNNFAWYLATCPVDGIRDGDEAVRLAERACLILGQRKHASHLDTLAAAHAEKGMFLDAITIATEALKLLGPQQESLGRDIKRRLEGYKAGKPWRQQP
ncbi:MAG: tetratricopeptide repeat protein [Planctomycetota bacterium]|jgi:Tfp pilus assembly protein PilF